MGEGGSELKREDTTRKLWTHYLHNAGNCILEALEFSIFLGCYLPLPLFPLPQRPCTLAVNSEVIASIYYFTVRFSVL